MAKATIEVYVNKYLFNRLKQILEAIQPFCSDSFYERTLSLPDNCPLQISVEPPGPPGLSMTITLGEWRKLFILTFFKTKE